MEGLFTPVGPVFTLAEPGPVEVFRFPPFPLLPG